MCVCVGMVRDAMSKRAVHPLASCYRKCDKEMLYTLSLSFALSRHHSANSTHRHTSMIRTYSGTTVSAEALLLVCFCMISWVEVGQYFPLSLGPAAHTRTLWLMRKPADVAVTVLPDIEWQSWWALLETKEHLIKLIVYQELFLGYCGLS